MKKSLTVNKRNGTMNKQSYELAISRGSVEITGIAGDVTGLIQISAKIPKKK